MTRRSKKEVQVDVQGKKGIVYEDYDEDGRGRRKRAKPTPPKPAIDIIVNAENHSSSNRELEEALAECIPAEPDFAGFQGDLDVLGQNVPDEPDDPSANKKTPNQLLREWLGKRCDDYLGALFEAHVPPLSTVCDKCGVDRKEIFSCVHFLGHQSLCSQCLVSAHRLQPTHQICKWNGDFWESTTLRELGLVLYLGHRGQPCSKTPEFKTLLVGDITGFHEVTVQYCTHENCPPHFIQLLCMGLFPCSDKTPKSAFTVACLDHFDLFQTLGAMSGQKYYEVMVKLTSAGFPGDVKDRYRELHLTHRRYCHLKNIKRSGSAYDKHPLEEGFCDHTVPCVGCPSPGFNYDPRTIPPKLLPFIRMWVSYDGNFANSRKAKKVDKDDLCLSDGLQYYVKNDPYEEWVKGAGKEREGNSKPECDNHKAAKSDTFGTWGGLDITGVGLFSCTRHTAVLPQGLVDFKKGEKYRYGDYAFGSMINYKLRRGDHQFGMTYDIWCHWIVNLKKRALEFPAHVSLPDNLNLIGGIPKWHLVGHKRVCHVRYSLNYTPHCGRMDGEGPERFWAYLNETCGSTSEKSPGYRRDTINNLIESWNFSKMIGIHTHIKSSFMLAKRMFQKQRGVFEELNASLPEDVTAKWAKEWTEAMLVDNKWQSPFYERDVPVDSFADTLRAEYGQESRDAHVPARKIGCARWVASAIELEHEMQKVRKLGTDFGQSPTQQQHESLSTKRTALSVKVTAHRQQVQAYMGDIGAENHPERRKPKNSEPEHSELGLPSSYTPYSLVEAGLSSMVELEVRLRKAMCDDALQMLRNLLGAKAAQLKFVKVKGKVSGERMVTKSQAKLKEHNPKIAVVQWHYNNSRSALMRLGVPEEEMTFYQVISPDDLKYLKVYLKDESGTLGEGSRTVPWLWRTSRVANEDEWQVEALKAEWFRSRERYRRWEEELYLLKREAIMARNSFKSMEAIWMFKARSPRCRPGMSAYAAKKSHFFRKLGDQVYATCDDVVKDPIVDIEWSSGWEVQAAGSTISSFEESVRVDNDV